MAWLVTHRDGLLARRRSPIFILTGCRTISHVKVTGQSLGHFSQGSRSLSMVVGYSIVGSEIPSLMTSFSSYLSFTKNELVSKYKILNLTFGV